MKGSLKTRPLGKTGVSVIEIGLGSVFITTEEGTSVEEGVRVVQRAFDLGLNYIDTAPYYGNSQKIIGEAIDGYTGPCLLGTKCGHHKDDQNEHRDLDALKRQFEQTLKDLRRDRVDLLYIHECDHYLWWKDWDPSAPRLYLDIDEQFDFRGSPVIHFLRWAKEQKLTKWLGIPGCVSRLVAEVLPKVDLPIDVVLIAFQYSLLWRNAPPQFIPVAKDNGVGVIVGTPLQQGRLAVPREDWLEDLPWWMDEDTRERFRALYEIQRESGLLLATIGLRCVQADSDIACVIVGAANVDQLEENLQSSADGLLPSALHERLVPLGKIFPDY